MNLVESLETFSGKTVFKIPAKKGVNIGSIFVALIISSVPNIKPNVKPTG